MTDTITRQRWFHYKAVLLTALLAFALWPDGARAQMNSRRLTPPDDCRVAGKPSQRIYQDLGGVALFVEVLPVRYDHAAECHGREEECADKDGVSATDSRRSEYIRELKNDEIALPPPLHRDNVVRVFGEAINKWIQPYVVPVDCKRPPVIVIGPDDLQKPVAVLNKPDVVTVAVRLNVIDSMAVLNIYFYRPDPAHSDFSSQVMLARTFATPTGLPDEQLDHWLEKAASLRIFTSSERIP